MDFKEDKAIYLQLADQVMEKIISKKWEQGNKIPSIRDTAIEVEVNPNTVMRTYNYLEDHGIIQNKRGIGFFVGSDAYLKVLELKKQDFIQKYLPEVFRMMDMLNISFDELKTIHENQNKR
jgi:GntR family transcriptional regulator